MCERLKSNKRKKEKERRTREDEEKKMEAERTRRRQRRLPRGRGAVKGCDSRSRATYRTPQVQRTDREVEGASPSIATSNAIDAIDSSGSMHATQPDLGVVRIFETPMLGLVLSQKRPDICFRDIDIFLTSSIFYVHLLRDKSEIFKRFLHVIVENSEFF